MRAFLAVARREIEEKRFVFAAALVASVVPFAVPLVRGLHGQDLRDTRNWLALILAGTLGGAVAVALGSTVVTSELADRRLGFYFSRPIGGFSLWAGKLGAACLVALAASGIVYAPAAWASGGHVTALDLPEDAPATFAVVLLALVFVFYAASILVRPRSPLLIIDLSAVLALGLGLSWAYRKLTLAYAMEASAWADGWLTILCVGAILIGGLLAVVRGRTDPRRAHQTLSTVLWGVGGFAFLSVSASAFWVLSAGPRDLRLVDNTLPAARGSWMTVSGPARGADPVFLFDEVSGRHERTGGSWRLPVISPDGTRAVWLEWSDPGGPVTLVSFKLDDPSARPARTTLTFRSAPTCFLSEHGERVAAIQENLLSIYDLRGGSSLGSVRLPGPPSRDLRGLFIGLGLFRVYRSSYPWQIHDRPGLEILEFDASTAKLQTVGAVPEAEGPAWSTNPAGDRLLVRERTSLTLRDGRSGVLLATLARRRTRGGFASGGRIVAGLTAESGVSLEVFGRDGEHERTISIPAKDRIALGGEIAPGRLIVAAGGESAESLSRSIFVVDLASGDVRKVADRLFPVVYLARWLSERPDYEPEPGSEATKLFYEPGRSLVRFDPLTGERRVILGKGSTR
jgi:hypothetical protein